MIVAIDGMLIEASPLRVVIELAGLSYEVHIPLSTAEKLPRPGHTVHLHTVAIYKEDSQTLYGFYTKQEREFFKLLVEKVSGIGPKIALTIMSKLSLAVLKTAIAQGDIRLLSQCPGIGKKTAERLVLELKDKVGVYGTTAGDADLVATGTGLGAELAMTFADTVSALMALGYKAVDADKAARKALSSLPEDASAEALLKKALSH
jgi:holliday junction DNA helicase RuvA